MTSINYATRVYFTMKKLELQSQSSWVWNIP